MTKDEFEKLFPTPRSICIRVTMTGKARGISNEPTVHQYTDFPIPAQFRCTDRRCSHSTNQLGVDTFIQNLATRQRSDPKLAVGYEKSYHCNGVYADGQQCMTTGSVEGSIEFDQ